MKTVLDWLLGGPAWIRYLVLTNLLDKRFDEVQCLDARERMLAGENVLDVISRSKSFDIDILKRHNDAAHPVHKIAFLSEIGLKKNDEPINQLVENIFAAQSEDGPFQVLSNYPTHFGGSGKDEWLWVLCDAPTLSYAMINFGYGNDIRVRDSVEHLAELITQNGWPCAASSALGNFRGPGKKTDPCPYANLIMLKLLSVLKVDKYQKAIDIGIETLLHLWENSQELRPYFFKMGTNFRKLKAPFIWYDILHVAEVLSRFPQCHTDQRFLDMIKTIESKADASGKYKSESIWTKWKGWEFCQKKEPSRWITFCVLRIQKRMGRWQKITPAVQ